MGYATMKQDKTQKLTLTIDGRQRLVLTAERITVDMGVGVIRLKCRCCGCVRNLGDFGVRRLRPGQPLRNQPWCRSCRSSRGAAACNQPTVEE